MHKSYSFPREHAPRSYYDDYPASFIAALQGCRKQENLDVRIRNVEPHAAAKKAKNIMVTAAGGWWRFTPAILNLPECESLAKPGTVKGLKRVAGAHPRVECGKGWRAGRRVVGSSIFSEFAVTQGTASPLGLAVLFPRTGLSICSGGCGPAR
jgi:hypothetical protein